MDRGEVVEVGPHDELMAKQGAYWRLYEAQARKAEAEGKDHDAVLIANALPQPSAHVEVSP
jgi:ATP-binding cassette subfamily B protein